MRVPDHRWTLTDRLVSYLDPVRGAHRRRARVFEAMSGAYLGGRRDRRQTQSMTTSGGSANTDMLPDLPLLRERSREMLRNEPLAVGAVNTVCTSVVGTGLAVQPTIDAGALGMSPEESKTWSEQAMSEWRTWAESVFCDATLGQNFYGLQGLAFRSALENGDVLALTPARPRQRWPYRLQIQLVEADRLCNPNRRADTLTVAGGVELDAYGAPAAYHFANRHPGDFVAAGALEWTRVPAFGAQTGRRNVLHIFDKVRVGQVRGLPYLTPVVETLKQLGKYTEAEVMAAVVSGMFTAFIHSKDGSDLLEPTTGAEAVSGPADYSQLKMGSGAIVSLAGDDQVTFADPSRPNQAFDPFVQAVLRQVGVALELPFEVLVKHFTASYSAARAALLEAWRFFRGRRAWLATQFCQPVYELFIDECVATGRLAAPGYFADLTIRAAYTRALWVGDGPGAIDPVKEATAAEKRMQIRLTTLREETMAYSGADWEENIDQIRREQQEMADLMQPSGTSNAGSQATDPNEDSTDGGSDLETPAPRRAA